MRFLTRLQTPLDGLCYLLHKLLIAGRVKLNREPVVSIIKPGRAFTKFFRFAQIARKNMRVQRGLGIPKIS